MNPEADRYEAACGAIFRNSVKWRILNPQKVVRIVWHFPSEVVIIAPISEAIKAGLVEVNDAALDLIKSLGGWGTPQEPTVLMVRVILEHNEL